mmetsp:Transcript_29205/g.53717  ORF Transcript_29205/g.53717 Transcript_29205/m.53717 type:complete len:219 (-) Transcript_29205:133-789(-)
MVAAGVLERCPYKVLGVARRASIEEVVAAYRSLARDRHPDKDKNVTVEQATSRFQELQAAYELLKNPEQRSAYDRARSARGRTHTKCRRRPRAASATTADAASGFFEAALELFHWRNAAPSAWEQDLMVAQVFFEPRCVLERCGPQGCSECGTDFWPAHSEYFKECASGPWSVEELCRRCMIRRVVKTVGFNACSIRRELQKLREQHPSGLVYNMESK